MSEQEAELIRNSLRKKPGTFTGREIEGICIHRAASSDQIWRQIAEPSPKLYLHQLKGHARAMIPQSIEYLRSDEPVAAVDSIIIFMVKACQRTGLILGDFIPPKELAGVRRAALLRGGRLPLDNPSHPLIRSGNGKEMFRAHAVIAGISPQDLGINKNEAERCLRAYFYKGRPRMKEHWKAAQKQAEFVNNLFPATA
ncbi:MAG: hypothetical protein JWL87_47 [Candidatus Adlerbacteria bacterium]|nr:hypothetical protein [Candidatus Adlerbacteria bacterium]